MRALNAVIAPHGRAQSIRGSETTPTGSARTPTCPSPDASWPARAIPGSSPTMSQACDGNPASTSTTAALLGSANDLKGCHHPAAACWARMQKPTNNPHYQLEVDPLVPAQINTKRRRWAPGASCGLAWHSRALPSSTPRLHRQLPQLVRAQNPSAGMRMLDALLSAGSSRTLTPSGLWKRPPGPTAEIIVPERGPYGAGRRNDAWGPVLPGTSGPRSPWPRTYTRSSHQRSAQPPLPASGKPREERGQPRLTMPICLPGC